MGGEGWRGGGQEEKWGLGSTNNFEGWGYSQDEQWRKRNIFLSRNEVYREATLYGQKKKGRGGEEAAVKWGRKVNQKKGHTGRGDAGSEDIKRIKGVNLQGGREQRWKERHVLPVEWAGKALDRWEDCKFKNAIADEKWLAGGGSGGRVSYGQRSFIQEVT